MLQFSRGGKSRLNLSFFLLLLFLLLFPFPLFLLLLLLRNFRIFGPESYLRFNAHICIMRKFLYTDFRTMVGICGIHQIRSGFFML